MEPLLLGPPRHVEVLPDGPDPEAPEGLPSLLAKPGLAEPRLEVPSYGALRTPLLGAGPSKPEASHPSATGRRPPGSRRAGPRMEGRGAEGRLRRRRYNNTPTPPRPPRDSPTLSDALSKRPPPDCWFGRRHRRCRRLVPEGRGRARVRRPRLPAPQRDTARPPRRSRGPPTSAIAPTSFRAPSTPAARATGLRDAQPDSADTRGVLPLPRSPHARRGLDPGTARAGTPRLWRPGPKEGDDGPALSAAPPDPTRRGRNAGSGPGTGAGADRPPPAAAPSPHRTGGAKAPHSSSLETPVGVRRSPWVK